MFVGNHCRVSKAAVKVAMKVAVKVAVLAALVPASLLAHTGERLAPHDLWSAWSFDPGILLPLVVAAALYVIGLRRLWRLGAGRGIRRWEAAAFGAGWLTLVIALLSPLHPLGEVLFSAHMVQHELLMVVAAPLLVLGRPVVPWLHALPMQLRRRLGAATRGVTWKTVWKASTGAGVAWIVQALVLWIWHLPSLFDAAVHSDAIHAMQHVCFLGASLLFWWALLRGSRTHARRTVALVCLFTTAMHSTLLGMLLATAPAPWYSAYATQLQWGITPLEDQQLAGLIMWIPACISYLIAALVLASAWLRDTASTPAGTQWATRAASILAAVAVLGLSACDWRDADHDAAALTHGNPARGQRLIYSYGCGSCHSIPGITGATGTVGPPLAGVASRSFIGGVLTNEPDNMMRWLHDPPAVDSNTAMPNVGLTPHDARDVAAYLYTLH